jgi:hypothetical protein
VRRHRDHAVWHRRPDWRMMPAQTVLLVAHSQDRRETFTQQQQQQHNKTHYFVFFSFLYWVVLLGLTNKSTMMSIVSMSLLLFLLMLMMMVINVNAISHVSSDTVRMWARLFDDVLTTHRRDALRVDDAQVRKLNINVCFSKKNNLFFFLSLFCSVGS